LGNYPDAKGGKVTIVLVNDRRRNLLGFYIYNFGSLKGTANKEAVYKYLLGANDSITIGSFFVDSDDDIGYKYLVSSAQAMNQAAFEYAYFTMAAVARERKPQIKKLLGPAEETDEKPPEVKKAAEEKPPRTVNQTGEVCVEHRATRIPGHRIEILAVSVCLLVVFRAEGGVADICVSERLTVDVIEGVVVSIPNGGIEPIPEAILELSECPSGECHKVADATADEKGRFKFENIEFGRYELRAKATNFAHYTATVLVRRRAGVPGGRQILIGLKAGLGCGGWAKLSERRTRRE
jgi:hypothetical protein